MESDRQEYFFKLFFANPALCREERVVEFFSHSDALQDGVIGAEVGSFQRLVPQRLVLVGSRRVSLVILGCPPIALPLP